MQTDRQAGQSQGRKLRLPWELTKGVQESASSRTTLCFLGIALLLILSLLVGVPAFAAEQQVILDAIRQVETGGVENPPLGDDGKALGPFQIHRLYWQDAVDYDPRLGPEAGYCYEDCADRFYAQLVVKAYMKRWVPEDWSRANAEVIARTHNGGPLGRSKEATDKYWAKVKRELEKRTRP